MKIRLIIEPTEITVLSEAGGVVCIEKSKATQGVPENITAVTTYYHKKLNTENMDRYNVLDVLQEGGNEVKTWEGEDFNSYPVVQDAVAWLNSGNLPEKLNIDSLIFRSIFPEGES